MTVYGGLGLIYGHQLTYDSTQVESDFTFLKSAGLARLQIAMCAFDDGANTPNEKDMVTRGKSHGFHVVWGNGCGTGNGSITSTRWSSFKSYVTGTLTPWAISNGLDGIILGNEEEGQADGTTITAATIEADIRTLATSVKNAGFTGIVLYKPTTGYLSNWISSGIGGLDYIAFDCYDTLANFTTNVASVASNFGSHGIVGEFGFSGQGATDYASEDQWVMDVVSRIAVLIHYNIPIAYYFNYRDGLFGSANKWGLIETDGTVRKVRQAVLSAAAAVTSFNKF